MSSPLKKIQKNAESFAIKKMYENMTPEQYQQGVREAIKITENRLAREYDEKLEKMRKQYNQALQAGTLIAMDTLAIEMLYELGDELECYKDEPEYLDQKIDVVQNLYETAMNAIERYGNRDNYKNDKQAQKEFERKKKTVEKYFKIIKQN